MNRRLSLLAFKPSCWPERSFYIHLRVAVRTLVLLTILLSATSTQAEENPLQDLVDFRTKLTVAEHPAVAVSAVLGSDEFGLHLAMRITNISKKKIEFWNASLPWNTYALKIAAITTSGEQLKKVYFIADANMEPRIRLQPGEHKDGHFYLQEAFNLSQFPADKDIIFIWSYCDPTAPTGKWPAISGNVVLPARRKLTPEQ